MIVWRATVKYIKFKARKKKGYLQKIQLDTRYIKFIWLNSYKSISYSEAYVSPNYNFHRFS